MKPDLSFTFRKDLQKDVSIYIGEGVSYKVVQILDDLKPDNVYIICDSKIATLYAADIKEIIIKKYPVYVIVHGQGEVNKNLRSVATLSDEFFSKGGTSKSVIIALGGGVTGNMAGFFASVVFRGIKLVHIPTTLLAQLDSAADVKQSVNSSLVKNSIGSYKAPDIVIIDTLFLKSLDARAIRSGLAEAIKHGMAQDVDFVKYIMVSNKRDLDALQKIIIKAITLKLDYWRKTPTIWNDSSKVERLTHLGHTTGKILEMIDVDYLSHGEAIAHGMIIEAYMSQLLGYLDDKSVRKIYDVLHKLDLLYVLNDKYTPDSILKNLYAGDKPIFALLQSLGNPEVISLTVHKKITKEALDWYFKVKGGELFP